MTPTTERKPEKLLLDLMRECANIVPASPKALDDADCTVTWPASKFNGITRAYYAAKDAGFDPFKGEHDAK